MRSMVTFLTSNRSILIVRLVLITFVFCGLFFLLELGLNVPHEYAVFTAFLVSPFIFLSFVPSLDPEKKYPLDPRKWTKFDLKVVLRSLGGFNKGFLEGLAVYLVLTVFVFVYYLRDPDFFSGYDKHGLAILTSIILTALNVMPLDFFTKRFIQLPLSIRFGPKIAIALSTFVWLLAHIPESLWLNELMGQVGVWVFLGFSGLLTGISYERTKNVSGLMAGHVMINIFVMAMAKL